MIPRRVTPPAPEAVVEFARDVREGLARVPKRLPSKYLYDVLGSSLFEAICQMPWYRVTRAEARLLERAAGDVMNSLQPPVALIELGSGSGEKLAMLVRAASRRVELAIHLVDISPAALELAQRNLARLPPAQVVAHETTYLEGLRAATRARPATGTLLVAFLGSNIGNFDPPQAREFLAQVRKRLRPGDALLLGVDLVKPEAELLLAYDDPLGVTAAFDKNVLARINLELEADFDLRCFRHEARWNRFGRRIEMHLVSLKRQRVRIARAHCEIGFTRGETIWTESSYKYAPDDVTELGASAGFTLVKRWLDDAGFLLGMFRVTG